MKDEFWGFETSPLEWREADLEALIRDRVAEGTHVEYKRSSLLAREPDAKKNRCVETLTKAVSAFNNSDGGILVLGLITEKGGKCAYPISLDEGVSESEYGKTWLVQIINGNVSPPVADLRVCPVPLRRREGAVAYVIYVPKGQIAVQARDFVYYYRVEDQSLPMKDYQIRDVNNRSLGPDLSISFGEEPGMRSVGDSSIVFTAQVRATNLSRTPAEVAHFALVIPECLSPTFSSNNASCRRLDLKPEIRLEYGEKKIPRAAVVHSWYHAQAFGVPPIFGLRPCVVMTVRLKTMTLQSENPLVWIAESPNMEAKVGWVFLEVNVGGITFDVAADAKVSLDNRNPLDWWRRGRDSRG